MTDAAGGDSPHLDKRQQDQAEDAAAVPPIVIHEVIRAEGMEELERSTASLLWSGLAAGLSVSFSFVVQSYLQAGLPAAPWHRLVDSLGYSVGFLIVVLGRQQLFTETTLTALIPTLTDRTAVALRGTVRVWLAVLAANLVGTVLFGIASAQDWLFSDEGRAAMTEVSAHVFSRPFWPTVAAAALAGWLIGLMVWLLPGAGPSRPVIIIVLTYVISLCGLPHAIAGSAEAVFSVASGHASMSDYFLRFLFPTLIGNSLGGTALAALLNHAPIADQLDGSGKQKRR